MTTELSPDTQAALLLTAPLLMGSDASSTETLTPGEYKRLYHRLCEMHHQPADLLGPDGPDIAGNCEPVLDGGRLQRLLERGFLLSQAVEAWQARALWVVSLSDDRYP
ncbi:MAG TPA: DNA-processing protein DprA, partial [Candidatus Hydrogenedentes bacterium]|nr:DNA-processing protein DprA [Candidatus Hydrogenedentota bacterium]